MPTYSQRKYVLASASPRREELLRRILPAFDVLPADIDESIDASLPLSQAIIDLAVRKAAQVSEKAQGCTIAADTVVVQDGSVLGKPTDASDAFRMLRMLSGNAHEVITGICIQDGARICKAAEVTRVYFRALTEQEIEDYIKSGEPMGKAGAYGIQGLGGVFIPRIEGCYYNVMGLPLARLHEMLQSMQQVDYI